MRTYEDMYGEKDYLAYIMQDGSVTINPGNEVPIEVYKVVIDTHTGEVKPVKLSIQ